MQGRRIRKRGIAGFAVVVLVCGAAAPAPALAQSGRLLDSSSVSEREDHADLSLDFSCSLRYQSHTPASEGDSIRIELRPGIDCNLGNGGQFPVENQLPADDSGLVRRIELSPSLSGGVELIVAFNRIEKFVLAPTAGMRGLRIRVLRNKPSTITVLEPTAPGTYAINLDSARQTFDATTLAQARNVLKVPVYVSEIDLDGVHWYRLRAGPFYTRKEADRVLLEAQKIFVRAWLAIEDEVAVDESGETLPRSVGAATPLSRGGERRADPVLDGLLEQARRASRARHYDEAVALLTKILVSPDYLHREQAQELLGLTRERKGQLAHAKAEYEEYLRRYPDGKAVGRVRKRLQALRLASLPGRKGSGGRDIGEGAWVVYGNLSQLYRRDNSQLRTDALSQSFVSQNAVLNDVDFVARRHDDRYDFTSRISAGYIKDLMPDGNNDQSRVSTAFVELRDRDWGLSARLGRQSRGMAGVLGSFDGLLASWQWRPRLGFDLVAGMPIESSRYGLDSHRRFVGVATDFGSRGNTWDTSVYAITQQYFGSTDRQSVGVETRYFKPGRTLVALVDYDLHFSELNNVLLLGTLLLPSRWTFNADLGRQSSPMLSTRNALIGQPVSNFEELMQQFTLTQLEQLAKDRSAQLTQLSATASHPWGEKAQISLNALSVDISGTPASGGVEAIPALGRENSLTSELLLSGLFKGGDITSIALRYSQGGTADVASLGIGSRLPLFGGLRLTTRLRADRRTLASDGSQEWIYLPSMRLDLNRRHSLFELEAGAEFGSRNRTGATERNTRYYISGGYRLSLDWDRR